jgi:hypothetical protein
VQVTPKKLKLLWGQTFFLSDGIFPPTGVESQRVGDLCKNPRKSTSFIYTIFRIAVSDTFLRMDGDCVASSVKLLYLWILYRFIAGKNILSRNLCRFVKGIHKLEPILSLHRCRKTFFCFFSIASSMKKFCPTKLYRFNCFFSQKLCIGIALIDTFLSIAAHLCKQEEED